MTVSYIIETENFYTFLNMHQLGRNDLSCRGLPCISVMPPEALNFQGGSNPSGAAHLAGVVRYCFFYILPLC